MDFGERRIGIAVSDVEKRLATGITTIDRRQQPDVFKVLEEFIRLRNVEAIVLGYPLRTDGKTSELGQDKTAVVDAFAEELKSRFGLPVHLEDESFSSSMAADSLRKRKGKRTKHRNFAREKAEIDRVAACIILQDWLDR